MSSPKFEAVATDSIGSVLPVTKKPKNYPLEIDGIGTNIDPFHIHSVKSLGHHDVHVFMNKAREEGYNFALGMPRHEWYRKCPDRSGRTNLVKASPGERGVFPVTIASVAFFEESTYEQLKAAN